MNVCVRKFRLSIVEKSKNGNSAAITPNSVLKYDVVKYTVNDKERNDFQQLMAAAVSQQAHQQKQVVQPAIEKTENRRRRIGSGRIATDSLTENNNNNFLAGLDSRYMLNELFKDNGKGVAKSRDNHQKEWTNSGTFDWSSTKSVHSYHNHHQKNSDSTMNSDEPEWANCGPISKHDIIELHGFDGPEKDDDAKTNDNGTDGASSSGASPPARSTPSKEMKKPKNDGFKSDDCFNFDDFLKLDLPTMATADARNLPQNKESRFTQWFGREGPANQAKMPSSFEMQQFLDYQQKVNFKKWSAGTAQSKFRSVGELEADWCLNKSQNEAKQPDLNAFRSMLNQIAKSSVHQTAQSLQSGQYLLNLINNNKNPASENVYQQQMAQNLAMKRPDAQLLLHRLVNCEISQYHLLQQINNPNVHARDRETLIAVLNFSNENQVIIFVSFLYCFGLISIFFISNLIISQPWLHEQQQQTLKHKNFMSAQLRQLQMLSMKNQQMAQSPNRAMTQQELQSHTQAIMHNAMLKKQFEDQCRKLAQGTKPAYGMNQQGNQQFKPNRYSPNAHRYHQKVLNVFLHCLISC